MIYHMPTLYSVHICCKTCGNVLTKSIPVPPDEINHFWKEMDAANMPCGPCNIAIDHKKHEKKLLDITINQYVDKNQII